MTFNELAEVINIIFDLAVIKISDKAAELEEIREQVSGILNKHKLKLKVDDKLETFYTDIIKLFAGLMTQDDKGKVRHEVTIDTDELFARLQTAYERIKDEL